MVLCGRRASDVHELGPRAHYPVVFAARRRSPERLSDAHRLVEAAPLNRPEAGSEIRRASGSEQFMTNG
jgi:hypothetical protein